MSRPAVPTHGPKISPDVEAQHQLLLQAWECAFSGIKVTYVSGPITTGPRFLRWFATVGRHLPQGGAEYAASLREGVVTHNERDILEVADRLRRQTRMQVIEPASLFVNGWKQADYHVLWQKVIQRFAERVVVLSGWNYSLGCVIEYCCAATHGIPTEDPEGKAVDLSSALTLIEEAGAELAVAGTQLDFTECLTHLQRLANERTPKPTSSNRGGQARPFRKDESLDRLADIVNVAQFVSFSPGKTLNQEYSRVRGHGPNHVYADATTALGDLLAKSADHSVNVRSFRPDSPQSHEFVYGLKTVDDALVAVERLAAQGLHVIANETVDIHDGGVSGVVLGNVVEFAPDDTPRCVEKPGVASLPRAIALSILTTAYGFTPDINLSKEFRLEFSIHPMPRGWRNTHTLGWELEEVGITDLKPALSWPNRFSRFIGDKAFGLMVANALGMKVPRTTVISRRVAPFSFGQETGSREFWIRTCPSEQVPGRYTTRHGWLDPYTLVSREDPSGEALSSILSQTNVPAAYSGAAIVGKGGELIVEGKRGEGESLMLNIAKHEPLPKGILEDVQALYEALRSHLGPVRFEWVHDGTVPWIVQLHRGATETTGNVIVPGEARKWRRFDVTRGLEALRDELRHLPTEEGLIIIGEVGLTSHIADVLRKAKRPARVQEQS